MIFFNSNKDLHQDEQGIVAIVVTMIIMIILTLIVTGFAQLARREQRSALDRQLASQAFYAAESGINDARRAIDDTDSDTTKNFNTSPSYLGQKDDCKPLSGINFLNSNDVSNAAGVKYSCLLINKKLKNSINELSIDKSNIQNLQSYSIATGSSDTLNQLQVSWQDTEQNLTSIYSNQKLPASSEWGRNIGILRMDIIPYEIPFSASSLKGAMFTVFLRPSVAQESPSIAYTTNPSAQGKVVKTQCDALAGVCKIKITGLNGKNYIVRMKSIYRSSRVVLCADNCDGSKVFNGNQTEVDSTGKAGDVLKRLKVRIPHKSNPGPPPEFTLDSSA